MLPERNGLIHQIRVFVKITIISVGLIFTLVKKLKPCGSDFPQIYSINSRYSIKVQELTEYFSPLRHNSPALGISMSNTYLDKAIEAVPRFAERI
jgi:uncharacterized membrane protein